MSTGENSFSGRTADGSHYGDDGVEGSDSAAAPMSLRSLAVEPPMQARLVAVSAARNPLLAAAQPLLRALADVPDTLTPEEVEVFHRLVTREVESFHAVCSSARIRHEHVVGASYALCTAIDERAHSTRWGAAATSGAGVWAARQLAIVFHDDARGGDKVFLLIGRLVAGPDEHIDLIEVLYFILGLGFEGRYGAAANGRRQIETIRHRLYTLLAASLAEVPQALSPQLQGATVALPRRLRSPSPWVSAVIATTVLLVLFGAFKYRLIRMEAEAVRRISEIGAASRDVPAAKPGNSLRLKDLLAAEITRGTVDVEEDAVRSAVSFRGDEMFVAGQARLNARIATVLQKVAAEIRQVAGSVDVIGHSDNRRVRTGAFRDNQVLSERRASAVAEVLESHGVERHRLNVVGRTDTEPVSDNATAAGRARNRRVDIVVTQGNPSDSMPGRSIASVPSKPSSGATQPLPVRQQ